MESGPVVPSLNSNSLAPLAPGDQVKVALEPAMTEPGVGLVTAVGVDPCSMAKSIEFVAAVVTAPLSTADTISSSLLVVPLKTRLLRTPLPEAIGAESPEGSNPSRSLTNAELL